MADTITLTDENFLSEFNGFFYKLIQIKISLDRFYIPENFKSLCITLETKDKKMSSPKNIQILKNYLSENINDYESFYKIVKRLTKEIKNQPKKKQPDFIDSLNKLKQTTLYKNYFYYMCFCLETKKEYFNTEYKPLLCETYFDLMSKIDN